MISIRKFEQKDFSAVSDIYQQGIDTGLATFQTDIKSWQEWNESILSVCRLVAEDEEHKVIGWAALSSVSSRCVYAGVAEVTIYVDNNVKRQGVGTQLLTALIHAAEDVGFWSLKAGIFRENEASILLHQKCGFRLIGYQEKLGKLYDQWHDVALMEYRSKRVGIN